MLNAQGVAIKGNSFFKVAHGETDLTDVIQCKVGLLAFMTAYYAEAAGGNFFKIAFLSRFARSFDIAQGTWLFKELLSRLEALPPVHSAMEALRYK